MSPETASSISLNVDQIEKLIPHRAPFLFIEKLTEIVPGESAVGWKTVSYNDPYFRGHFPDYPVMPGVLIIEALAQTAGALVMHSLGATKSNVVYFMTIDKARFRRPVRPGDMLRMPVRALQHRGPVWRFSGEALVDDKLCAEAEYSAMIAGKERADESASDGGR